MNLTDLFSMLCNAELSNTSLADVENDTIETNRQKQVVSAANLALTRLYAKFVLAQKEIIIQCQDGVTFYHLLQKYAQQSAEDGVTPYILDLNREKFTGDVIKPLSVWCPDFHDKLPVNDDNNKWSVFLPQTTILQVPWARSTVQLSMIYQAKHTPLVLGSTDETQTTIVLPDVLVEAFTSYIGYKVYSDLNTDNSTAKAQEFLAMFDKICDEATADDLVNSSTSTTNSRFATAGWV